MVKKRVPSLRITPKKSIQLASFILITHLSAFSISLFIPLEFWVQLTVLSAVTASMIHSVRTHIVRANGTAIKSAEWNSEGEWALLTVNGNEVAAQLQASSCVQPWFIILNFSTGRFKRCSLILLPDAIDPELLRSLRVRLKLLGSVDAVI